MMPDPFDTPPPDPEDCPGCGCKPGDGITRGCEAEAGCGYYRAAVKADLALSRPAPFEVELRVWTDKGGMRRLVLWSNDNPWSPDTRKLVKRIYGTDGLFLADLTKQEFEALPMVVLQEVRQ